jgi:molybdopterin molybdotransferase
MSAGLKPLDELLQPVLRRLSPVLPGRVPLASSSGSVTAEPVRASRALPERAVALRTGLAVTSLDLVGATPQSPLVLTSEP